MVRKIIFYVLLFAVVVGMECLFKKQMQESSLSLIVYWQQAKFFLNDNMEHYLLVWYFVGQVGILMFLVSCLFPIMSRQGAFYYLASFSVGLTTCAFLRLAFRDPRPFMIDL